MNPKDISTIERALGIIEGVMMCGDSKSSAALECAVNMIDEDFVKQVLEKQIPKRPMPHKVDVEKIKIGNGNWCKGTTVYKCPRCDTFISKTYGYCYKCGQALDWSDG